MRFWPGKDTDTQLDKIINRGLNFYDNFQGVIINVDLEFGKNQVRHSLGYVPIGYLVLVKQNEGEVYGTETDTWTEEILFLVSSAQNQRVRLFVM